MKKNNKGFTLIELIGVIIIIALLLLIVFPATVRLIKDNDQKKYDYYYDIVLKGANLYASSRRDDLGGNSGNGCVKDVKVSDLIEKNYIKVFDDEEVKCGSPSEFTADERANLGLTGSYIDIKIVNDKGKYSSEASLICVKGEKLVYSKLVDDTGSCDKYVAEAENVLLDSILSLGTTTDDNRNYFVSGTATNNYVWYSGKMWRVVSFNKVDRTIKLVTDQAISTLSYDMAYSNYSESNVSVWLNNNFLKTLKNPQIYLLDATWNFTTVADASLPASTNTVTSKVGLLNYYEYSKVQGFLNLSQSWWLLSRASNVNAWYVNSSNTVANTSVATFMGVRPSIVLKANVTYVAGGTGSQTNPYRLSGDSSANIGSLLNTRYSGEYVSFAGAVYRISETTDEYTRLVAVNNVSGGTMKFHYHASNYSAGTTVGEFLNSTWVGELSSTDKSKLYVGDFCIKKLTPKVSQTTACAPSDIVYVMVGLPRIGDMFTTASSSGEYWTLSPVDEASANIVDESLMNRYLNVISTNGTVVTKDIEETSGVKQVISIVGNAKIASGNGTASSPYQLQ